MSAIASSFSADAESILRYLARTKREIERTRHAMIEPCQLANSERAEAALKQLISGGWIDALPFGDSYILSAKGKEAAKQLGQKPRNVFVTTVSNVQKGGHVVLNGQAAEDITLPTLPFNNDDTAASNSILPFGARDSRVALTPVKSGQITFAPQKPAHIPEIHIPMEPDTLRTLHTDGLPRACTHMLRMHDALMPENGRGALLAPIHYLLAFETYPDVLPVPIFNGDVLGRARTAHIRLLHDLLISKHHCRFSVIRSGGGMALAVEDLDSMNGTMIDGKLLRKGEIVKLKHGTRFTVARTALVVVAVPSSKNIG